MQATLGHQAGLAAAVMTAGLDVGKMIGPLIGGLVAAAAGIEPMFRIVPFAFLGLYLVLFVAPLRHRRPAGVADATVVADPATGGEAG